MKRYLFGLHYQQNNLQSATNYHEEMFECDADAMQRAREILREGKRDVNAYLVSVYGMRKGNWLNIVNYQ